MTSSDGQSIIEKLVRWAEARESVQAVLLTSSRTRPAARLDAFSDYDVILVVSDVRHFLADESWLGDFGQVLVVYRDPVQPDRGFERFTRVTQYEDGTKIDFAVWPVGLLKKVAAEPVLPAYLDDGYTVVLDKKGITEGLRAPSYSAYVPAPPTAEEYRESIEEFFSESCYVAKQICRGEIFALKYNLDHVMKFQKLRQMLGWLIETENGWSIRLASYGRGLTNMLNPEIRARLERTYVGAGAQENWSALFDTITLFRDVATEVGLRLGYAYPKDLDGSVSAYLTRVRESYSERTANPIRKLLRR